MHTLETLLNLINLNLVYEQQNLIKKKDKTF